MVLSPYHRAQLVESLAALGREGAARGVEIHRDCAPIWLRPTAAWTTWRD